MAHLAVEDARLTRNPADISRRKPPLNAHKNLENHGIPIGSVYGILAYNWLIFIFFKW